MYAANLVTENGDSFIPASQRPDGTWRKARRVKEGYVPQEEVPLYESKGKQFLNQQAKLSEPVRLPSGQTAHRTIPGLFIVDDKEKKQQKKKNKKVEEIASKLDKTKITDAPKPKQTQPTETPKNGGGGDVKTDPAKRLKNLKKRLREIEALENKVKSDDKIKLEPEQTAKLQRKKDLLMEIRELEKTLQK